MRDASQRSALLCIVLYCRQRHLYSKRRRKRVDIMRLAGSNDPWNVLTSTSFYRRRHQAGVAGCRSVSYVPRRGYRRPGLGRPVSCSGSALVAAAWNWTRYIRARTVTEAISRLIQVRSKWIEFIECQIRGYSPSYGSGPSELSDLACRRTVQGGEVLKCRDVKMMQCMHALHASDVV
jgi:hypothetical protein